MAFVAGCAHKSANVKSLRFPEEISAEEKIELTE